MNTKYLLGSLVSIPLLPIMFYQGIRIRSSVPELPEATGNQGFVKNNSTKTFRLICIGESTIAGIGVKTHEEGFSGTLAKELASELGANVKWKVYAKSGFTAKDVNQNIVPQIEEKSADLIVIGLGGNDSFKGNSPTKWRKNVQELIDSIRVNFPNTPIAFTNLPPIKGFPAFTPLIKITIGNLVEILGEELEKLVKSQENVYFNSELITFEKWIKKLNMDAKPSDFFSDGVHPSKLTYQVWAKDFSKFIVRNIKFK